MDPKHGFIPGNGTNDHEHFCTVPVRPTKSKWVKTRPQKKKIGATPGADETKRIRTLATISELKTVLCQRYRRNSFFFSFFKNVV